MIQADRPWLASALPAESTMADIACFHRHAALAAVALAGLCLAGCASDLERGPPDIVVVDPSLPAGVRRSPWTAHAVATDQAPPPTLARAVDEREGAYRLDTGDRLRIFVYGQPSLSRGYIVDQSGRISVPLIGEVAARGLTTTALERKIAGRLGATLVRDPQVTVDVQQNRPFFILGEVKTAGQYPYVSGLTIETAVAIAGGYSERAETKRYRVTRRVDGEPTQIEAPADFVLRPGDTVTVLERWF